MTLMRSLGGKLYDIPEKILDGREICETELDALAACLPPQDAWDPGPPEPCDAAPQVVIVIEGGVEDPGPPCDDAHV